MIEALQLYEFSECVEYTDKYIGEDAFDNDISINDIDLCISERWDNKELRLRAINDLLNVYQECMVDDWDGYGAKSVSSSVYEIAKKFLISLPPGTQQPEIAADPDGEIAFEWLVGPGRTLSISIGETGILSYAGIFDEVEVSGTEHFKERLPSRIAELLCRWSILKA